MAYAGLFGLYDPTRGKTAAGTGEAKEITTVTAGETDLIFVLNPDNTEIKWTGSNSAGLTPTGYFFELTGEAIVDPLANQLKHFALLIDMHGVAAMNATLTDKLKNHGFFEVDQFPQSTFTMTSVRPADAEGSSSDQYLVEGNFQLRDVTKSISFPAKISIFESGFNLTSEFSINRKDFGVVYSNSTEDALIRDDVLINIDLRTERTATAMPNLAENMAPNLAEEVQTDPVDLDNLLPVYTETIPSSLVEFEMVLVPGDDALSIKPFYIGKHEVSWDEFLHWALCQDVNDRQKTELVSMELRPSQPHDVNALYRGWGRDGQPAVGVSFKTAELYCQWLSEQTGKRYRLPTHEEWKYAFEQGIGPLDRTLTAEEADQIAWFEDNTFDDDTFDNRAMPIGTKSPDKLGLHDMLGNAAEWVTDSNGENVVVGGNFVTSLEDLVGDFREVEDQNVWNKNYPQSPKSKWWYQDADYVGFRLVREL